MSLKKRFTGDYTIEAIDGGELIVDGDFRVVGTTTLINTTELEIIDNNIILNSGETGPGITHPSGEAGIEIDRGDGVTAGQLSARILFDENDDTWKIDPGTGTPVAIATAAGAGINNVVEDLTPQLGGDLDVNGHTITSAGGGDIVIAADTTGVVKVDQELTLLEQSAPPALASYSKLYANTAGAGGSGLYYVNNSDSDELVSRKKAMVFGLIF